MDIVLDKSYLEAASKDAIGQLCDKNRVFMSESLFYELLTTTSKQRAMCFDKFPEKENPVEVINCLGFLLRYETKNKRPSCASPEFLINVSFRFNKGLSEEGFVFTNEQQGDIDIWKKDKELKIKTFKECSAGITCWFPELENLPSGSSIESIQGAVVKTCQDVDFIRCIYEDIKHGSFPSSRLISKEWVFFRRMQVHLLAVLEYIRRYGSGNSEAISKKIENDFLDIEYCILACVVCGLASRDRMMREMFQRLCPEGTLMPKSLIPV
ncbi:hypothetical protein MNBD_DELTA01-582 [hydrothermal vent metagenome]|uniref:Uncharacterized protein n=1 Tax=hydrothermal vent metagenome TaxID=652676 RepID=A0A3B0RAB7_9ZZZZ